MVKHRLTGALTALVRGPGVLTPSPDDQHVVVGPEDEPVTEVSPPPQTNGHEVPAEHEPMFEQWGLKLPNGDIVWDDTLYQGLPLQSPQQREVLVSVLRKTAEDLSFEENAFLGHYGWARRYGVPAIQWGDTVVLPLAIHNGDDSLVPLEQTGGQESEGP